MTNLITRHTFLMATLGFLLLSAFSKAQTGQITGLLTDKDNQAVPFANVVLYSLPDSSMITGSVSSADGNFMVKAPFDKAFFLKISAVGYQTFQSAKYTLSASTPILQLDKIEMTDDLAVLGEVEVTALRPQVMMEADKMVVSVEGTALAAGSSVYEVIEKSPGVFVDQDGNIQLNGKEGVQIMIDGRLTYLSAEDLRSMLQGMSAENLKNIEIITNPSAKYDAQGNSGIINITLKKNTIRGVNGSVNAGARYNGLLGYETGVRINHKKGNWNSFVNADLSQRTRLRDAHLYRVVRDTEGNPSIFDQDGHQENIRLAPTIRLGTDYDFNDRQSLGVMFNIYAQDAVDQFDFNTLLTTNNIDTTLITNNNIKNRFMHSRANIHYTYKLDTNGTKISTDFNFIRLANQGNSTFANEYYVAGAPNNPVKSDLLKTDNPNSYDIYSGQIDFETKLFKKYKVETGVKASSVTSNNNLKFYEIVDNQSQFDENRSNHFIYSEQILAAYTSISGRINPKLSYQLGLRAEQTYSEGESITKNQVTPRDYFNWFPSVFVQQTISDNYQVNYNYSKRIDRPDYDNLNPFIFYLDPKTTAQGNPYLRPQISHSFGVTQTFYKQFNLVLNASKTSDVITEIPFQNAEDGTTVFMQENMSQSYNYSGTAVIPFQPFKWWGINNNVTVFHQDFEFTIDSIKRENKQTTYMLRTSNTFSLPGKYRIELNADYRSGLVWGVYEIDAQWGIDLGFKKSFFDGKLDASLNFSDVLRTRQWHGNSNFAGNINDINQYFGQQSVGFSLRYKFSKGEEFKARQRNTNLDELNRAGG